MLRAILMLMPRVVITPSVEYLVAASGGTGWTPYPDIGGGGAGGVLTATGYVVTPGVPISLTVGAGVAAGYNQGNNSTFGTITCYGGGAAGAAGGSGGGKNTGGSGTNAGIAGQGYRGGAPSPTSGSGGGGAGGVGADAPTSTGGPGLTSSISGASVTYGVGAGIGAMSSTPGSGAYGANPSPDGVVIIRYPNTYPLPTSTTGSPTITTAGGYHIITWNTPGTWSITF